jgi:hypothetical protein
MRFLVIEQPPGPDKARGCDHNQRHSDDNESEPVVAAKGPGQPFELQSTARIERTRARHCKDERLNFSTTNPNAITALPVRTQARNVRSLAA